MIDPTFTSAEDLARFEIFPAGSIETQAAELPRQAHITITCSPKHGPDHSVEAAGRLRDLGHTVTVHVAARMVRDRSHLDALLAAMKDAGADDLFLVAGDIEDQLGEYASAVELLPILAEHPQRPPTIGITGIPRIIRSSPTRISSRPCWTSAGTRTTSRPRCASTRTPCATGSSATASGD